MEGNIRMTHSPKNFVEKLWGMVNDPSNTQSIRWTPTGESFLYTPSFENDVLKNMFHLKSLSSFVRQLNMYGFKKRKNPGKISEFFHPHFRRDRQEDLYRIRRKHLEDNLLENAQPSLRAGIEVSPSDQLEPTYPVRLLEVNERNRMSEGNFHTSQMWNCLEFQRSTKENILGKFVQFVDRLQESLDRLAHSSEDRRVWPAGYLKEHMGSSSPPLSFPTYEALSCSILCVSPQFLDQKSFLLSTLQHQTVLVPHH